MHIKKINKLVLGTNNQGKVREISKLLPKKIILMDLDQVGSSKNTNYRMLRKYLRYSSRYDLYIAGGIKTALDLNKAKSLGAKGVLVSSLL